MDTQEFGKIIFIAIATYLPKIVFGIIFGLLILGGFVLVARIVRRMVMRLCKTARLNQQVERLISQCVYISLMAFGVIGALGSIGVDVSALVASLGLTGFAVGFALKDTISNVLSGVLLLIYKPFHIGDRVTVGTYNGDVVAMDLRYTSLVGQEQLILVPNSFMFSQPIVIHVKTGADHK